MSADEPRPQHYLFAHRALPQIIHDDPGKALALLTGPEADTFLSFFWERVGQGIPPLERTASRGLARTVRKAPDGRVAVIITLPAPEHPPEAYFVAAVFTPGARRLLFLRHPPTVRYLTLEYGTTLGGEARTVLCGWSQDETHFNLGDGPPPEIEAFAAIVLPSERGEVS